MSGYGFKKKGRAFCISVQGGDEDTLWENGGGHSL
ncbi:uncharacterized protein FMAN_10153 [Fusarium mangiferae]|uniref:Uncharacterized protein n=1 Tax=Fusarium mangiferae TaxID=192010 RepID=A0A1L7U033_FUSMA|nr:uncharacterized protein FMAN_10153 [Fusarium mangiferae]CVL00881.1 uncharacterized protein FMAN_10153 [Fusarium mangiferae]